MQAVVSMRSHGYLASLMMRVMMMIMSTVAPITVVDTGRKITGSRQITRHPDQIRIVLVRRVILASVNDKRLLTGC